MHSGFDRLCGYVQQQMGMKATNDNIFIFMNKPRNQVKLLCWEGDGFSIYHKRLEKGCFEMPEETDDKKRMNITSQQLQLILNGISLKSVHKRKRYQHFEQKCE